MGLRFRKSIKLGGGFRLNLSKSGVGYSWGTKGFRISKSAKGRTRKTFSVPGTGISYSTSSGKSKRRKSTTAKQNYSQSNTDFTEQLPVDPKVQRIKKTAITAIIAGLVLDDDRTSRIRSFTYYTHFTWVYRSYRRYHFNGDKEPFR